MKSKLNFLLLCFLFTIIYLFPKPSIAGNFWLNHTNKSEILDSIEVHLNSLGTISQVEIEAAILELNTIFENDLQLDKIDDSACEQGILKHLGNMNHPSPNESSTAMYFRWDGGASESYYRLLFDALTLAKEENNSPAPGFVVNIEESFEHKILILNGRCGELQGTYNIIIIDREINLVDSHHNNFNLHSISFDTESKKEHIDCDSNFSSQKKFSVFPNPAISPQVSVKFRIDEPQTVSIYILEASSGKLIEPIFLNMTYQRGIYIEYFNTAAIKPGVYIIILQTELKQFSKKWINP